MSKETNKRATVKIKATSDTVCRDGSGDLVEVKKDQTLEADEVEGRHLVTLGKAELVT